MSGEPRGRAGAPPAPSRPAGAPAQGAPAASRTVSAEHDGGDAVAGAGGRAVRQLRVEQGGLRGSAVRPRAEREPGPPPAAPRPHLAVSPQPHHGLVGRGEVGGVEGHGAVHGAVVGDAAEAGAEKPRQVGQAVLGAGGSSTAVAALPARYLCASVSELQVYSGG